jgi:hypothetical protein
VDPVISPDGKRIACLFRSVAGQQLTVVDRESGLFTTLVSNGFNAAPVWMPDGKSLMFDGVDSKVLSAASFPKAHRETKLRAGHGYLAEISPAPLRFL